jgi:cell division transport system ATP-binding protein
MEDRLRAFPLGLSGGEQQKVAVARAVVGEPKIILADEPTGSLDSDSAENIFKLLTTFHERGTTVLFATHDTALIRDTKHRVIYLNKGCLQT